MSFSKSKYLNELIKKEIDFLSRDTNFMTFMKEMLENDMKKFLEENTNPSMENMMKQASLLMSKFSFQFYNKSAFNIKNNFFDNIGNDYKLLFSVKTDEKKSLQQFWYGINNEIKETIKEKQAINNNISFDEVLNQLNKLHKLIKEKESEFLLGRENRKINYNLEVILLEKPSNVVLMKKIKTTETKNLILQELIENREFLEVVAQLLYFKSNLNKDNLDLEINDFEQLYKNQEFSIEVIKNIFIERMNNEIGAEELDIQKLKFLINNNLLKIYNNDDLLNFDEFFTLIEEKQFDPEDLTKKTLKILKF